MRVNNKVFNSMSDVSLVMATRLGFTEAYGELAQRYRRAVRAVVMSVIPSNEMAEDIVQDAFLVGLRSLKQLKNPAKFASWIRAIAKNQALRGCKETTSRFFINISDMNNHLCAV